MLPRSAKMENSNEPIFTECCVRLMIYNIYIFNYDFVLPCLGRRISNKLLKGQKTVFEHHLFNCLVLHILLCFIKLVIIRFIYRYTRQVFSLLLIPGRRPLKSIDFPSFKSYFSPCKNIHTHKGIRGESCIRVSFNETYSLIG